MKKVRYLIVSVSSAVLAFLSNLEPNQNKQWLMTLNDKKVEISIVCFACIVLLEFYEWCFAEDHTIRNWTKKFLRFIAKEKLGGAEYNTRISILRPQKGWRFILKYIWYSCVLNSIENFKNGTWKRVLKNIPIHLFSDYLTVFTRFSYPKEETSMTYFRVSQRNEGNGVADKCYKEGTEIEVKTCNISELQIPDTYDKLRKSKTQEHKLIRKYMNDSYIDSSHFASLLNMKTRANNLYALAITNDEEKVWGVLIIDNVNDSPRSFKEELADVVEDYAKIFCFTLATVK